MMKPVVPDARQDASVEASQAPFIPEYSLPDASFLLYGVFSQDGFDLVITNPAGDKVTVADYFSFEPPPNLVLANGASLTPAMVESLFPRAFSDEVLFAGPAPSGAALTEIGTITLVVGTVTVRHADGTQDTLSKGDILYKGDVILTAAGSFVKAEMLDGTRFHLGQSGEVALDDFTFDETAGQGQFDATIRVGGFYYKSGEIAEMSANLNQAHTRLTTPSAIIGVRGSELEGSVSPDGQTVVVHRSGILEITDLNGENPVTLVEPGNTAIVILNGVPAFSPEPPQEVEIILEQSLLPPPGPGDGPGPGVNPANNMDQPGEGPGGMAGNGVAGTQAGNATQSNNTVGPGDGQGQQQGPSNDGPANSPGSSQSLENLSSVNQATPALISVASFETNAIETQQMPAQVTMIAQPNIELLPVDSPPLTQPDTLEITGTAPLEISSLLLANDDDPDTSGELTVISASGGTGSFDVDQGNVTYFPDQALLLSLGANETETQIITYEVESGGQIASGVLTITYLGENEAPVVQSETAQISEDTQLELQVLDNATDTDVQDTLTIASLDTSNLTGTAEISADGQSLIYNPPQDMDSGTRTEVFSYSVSDGTATSTATVTITVAGSNDAPVIESDPTSFSIDAASGLVEIPISSIFSDADGASVLTVVALDSVSTLGASLSVGSVVYDPGNIFITLSEDEIDTDSFAITVQDQHGATASGTFTFQVIGANDAPIANSDSGVLAEDGSVSADALSGVLDNDLDPDTSDTLLVSSLRTGVLSGSGPSAMPGEALQGTYGTLTLYADGSYEYQANLAAADALATGEVATDVFTYTVSDDASTSLSADAELAFTITGTNDAPTLGTVAPMEEFFDVQTGQLIQSASFTYTDIDGDGTSYTVFVQEAGDNTTSFGDFSATLTYDASTVGEGQVDWTFVVNNNDIVYLPEGEVVVQNYIVTITDDQGGSFDQSISMSLIGANDGPLAYADNADVEENGVVTVTSENGVLSNDSDPDQDGLSVLSVRTQGLFESGYTGTLGESLLGTYGTLTLYADGSYEYQANLAAADALAAGEVATDVFTYTVSDDALTSLSADAELAFTITGTNDAPLLLDATEVSATVTELADNDPGELTDHLTGTGSFTFEDVDLETHTVSVQAVGSNATSLGDFDVTVTEDASVDGSGLVQWSLTVVDADLDYLEEEEALTQDYIITVSDGQGSSFDQTVTVTLVGSYDSANSPPYLDTTDLVHEAVVIEESYSETFLFYDVDGDALTLGYAIPAEIDTYLSFTPDVTTDTNGYTQGTMILSGLFVEGMAGDYLITVSADDGVNEERGDTFVLSVRDPDLIVEGEGHQFVAGEAELVVSNHGDDPGLGDVELIDAGPGDRVQFMAHIDEIYLTSDLGSTVTLDFSEGGGFIDASESPGPDTITIDGDTSGLNFYNLGWDDTLINETTIDATGYNFTLDGAVENNGDIHVSSSSNGNYYTVGVGTNYETAVNLAHPVYTGNFTQGESGVLEVSSENYATYGGYMLTLELENAGSISVSGATDMYGTGTAVLEVQSVSTGQLEMGAISQSASGTLSIGGGGIVSAGSLDNDGLVVLEVDYYNHASLLLDGTYTESGTLWSTASDFYYYYYGGVNEIYLDSFVLTASGQIVLDAPLLFTNPNQTVDLRLGQVDFDPNNGALGLEGGTLILGENSDFLGYGRLGFFDGDQSHNDTGTIVIDTTYSTSNFVGLGLAGAAVTLFPYDNNAVLVVAHSTELDLYDSDVIETDLVNQGWIFVGGADNEINGDFDNSAGLLAIEVGYSTTETGLQFGSVFDNQGIIEIRLETSVPSSTSQTGGYPEFNANLTSVEPWTNTGSIFIEDDVTVEDDGYGNSDDPVYDFNVNIQAEMTNYGTFQVEAGQVTLDQMTNGGIIRVIGSHADFSELSSLNGASLVITGDLVLEESSLIELEVNLNSTDTMTVGGLQADLIQPSSSSAHLGTLSLLFDANHNFYPDNDAATANAAVMSLDLGSSYQQGANFNAVQTNLAAGYDLEFSQDDGAITLDVSDGMEAVVSQASQLSQVASTDDVRIIGTITLDQASQTINSFSIEKWTPEDTGTQTETIGSLQLGDGDSAAESFELIVADDSTVAPSLELYVGAGNEGAGNDTSVLTLGGLLTINGSLQLDEGGQINSNGNGSITIADEASADLEGGTLDLNLTVLQGGWVNAGASGETLELDGQGSITNHSELYLSGNLTLGIDVNNQYRTEINGGAQVSLAAGAGIVFTNEGVLGTDADDDVSFDLADNVLDTRGGEIALFMNEDTYTATLSGGDGENSGIIRMDSETTFAGATSDYYDCPTLVLTGDLTLSLTGVIDVDAMDDSYDVTLDGSGADSLQLINEGSGTALFVNHSYVYFNNLTTASDVTLANFNDMSISGVSVIEGDLYTSFDFDDVYEDLELDLDDDITIRGHLYNEPGTEIWAGYYSDQLTMVVDNDFVNEGDFYFHPNNTNINIIEFGEGINTATFTNEGAFYAGDTEVAVQMELQGIIINQGHFELESASILKLYENTWAVTHENNGVMVLNEDSVLALGEGNILLNGQSGELYAAANALGDYSTIDLTSTNASFINEGVLYLADGYMYGYASEDYGVLRIRTSDDSGEVVFESGSQLNMDYALYGSSNHDQLQITSTGSSGGVLSINGGYLNINQAGTSATASTVMITAVSILGSFDEVGGLFLDGDPDYALLDMVQTQTSISLVAVATSDVIEGTSGADTIDMSAATETFVIAGEDDDVIVNIRSGDTAYGQAGDDTFELSAIDVKRIDGGEGIDSIVLPDVTESFVFLASSGWHGTTFDNIEVLRMDDASDQTLVMEAADISRIIDGGNELVDDATALVVVGNIGDEIDLYGDFAAGEDRYAEIDATPTLFSEVHEGDVSLYFDQHTRVHVYENDGGVSIYGTSEDDALEGTAAGETLSGRAGDDVLDAGSGADVQLGGDGNDQIMFDAMDTLIDGGRGVDTAVISGNVDLSGVENLNNFEILDMSDNGTADTLELNLADLVDIVGDNSLNAYEEDSENKVLVINGDAEDAVLLNGLDLDAITPTDSEIDLFGDGELYYLFQENGVSLYVHSDLSDTAEENAQKPASGLDLHHYLHDGQVDAFGMI